MLLVALMQFYADSWGMYIRVLADNRRAIDLVGGRSTVAIVCGGSHPPLPVYFDFRLAVDGVDLLPDVVNRFV